MIEKPDFKRFRTAVTRQGTPDRIPLAEVGIDTEVIEAYLGRPLDGLKTYVEFFRRAHYDYVLLQVRGQPIGDARQLKIAEGQLQKYSDSEQSVSTCSEGVIVDEESFEKYPWITHADVYYKDVDELKALLPDGMKVVVNCGPVFQSIFRMMGAEAMAVATIENPALLRALADKVGEFCVEIVENLVQRDWVGAIWYGDDMAYTTGLLVSPALLREYVFPYMKRIGDLCKEYDKPFIFHSDGKLEEIMEDLIDCGVQATHPNEPQSVDMAEVKRKWGDRLSQFGGIDLDLLSRGTEEQVITEVKTVISRLRSSGLEGIALGSSNSVAKYVPVKNYRAMLNTVLEYGVIN
jgi:uroporphyrinogen decarboxylase